MTARPGPSPLLAQAPAGQAAAVPNPGRAVGGGQPGHGTAQRPGPGGTGRSGGGRRPLDRWKAAFVLLAIAGIVAGVAWALLGSRFLVVRSVQITGLHRVSRAQVLAAAGIRLGLPLIRVDAAVVSRRVEAITQVRSARVSRSWPDAVVINVTERTPELAVRTAAGYDLIDPFGVVVVASVPRRPAGMPLFVPSGPIRGNPAVLAAADVAGELTPPLRRRLVSVAAPTADGVTLRLTGGVTIVWGSDEGAAVKDRVLKSLMRTGAHYYDVSAPTVATTR
jgi:cell division protein FtsQ